jgi:hypothetical protein
MFENRQVDLIAEGYDAAIAPAGTDEAGSRGASADAIICAGCWNCGITQ